MTNTNGVQEPIVDPKVIGNEAITTTINQVKDVWRRGAEDRLRLGELFSQLRNQVEVYRKDEKGLTYNQAVASTGVPRGTAERYREMYDTFRSSGIQAEVFLALAEHGCNLATDRTITAAGILSQIPNLNSLETTDEDAVKKMAKIINRDYPVVGDEAAATPIEDLEALLENLGGMDKNPATEKMIANTRSAITKTQKSLLLTLATALAPFIGKNKKWAEQYVQEVANNSTLLKQRYTEALTFAKSATFLTEENN